MNPVARPAWMDEGEEPDYRFSLANERTFLAWVRTTLALIAGAVAVVQLVPFDSAVARTALGLVLAGTAVVTSSLAYRRWSRVEQAMRGSRPLPHSVALPVLSGALSIVAVIVLAITLIQ